MRILYLSVTLLILGVHTQHYRAINFDSEIKDLYFTPMAKSSRTTPPPTTCNNRIDPFTNEQIELHTGLMGIDLKFASRVQQSILQLQAIFLGTYNPWNDNNNNNQNGGDNNNNQNNGENNNNQNNDYIHNNENMNSQFVWVNDDNFEITQDPTTADAGQTFTLYPFNPKWYIPVDVNNKPLWDPNDPAYFQNWDLQHPPQRYNQETSTQVPLFDISSPPKFKFIRPEWYTAIYQTRPNADGITKPFSFVAVSKVTVNTVTRWEVVWRANLSNQDNVAVLPFGSEFFIAEGKTIAEGTWWDLQHPPNGPDSQPLWTVGDISTYPKFIFDQAKFDQFREIYHIDLRDREKIFSPSYFKDFFYVSKTTSFIVDENSADPTNLVPFVNWWFAPQKQNNGAWENIFNPSPYDSNGKRQDWYYYRAPINPTTNQPYWTQDEINNGIVKFKFTDTGKELFSSLYKRFFDFNTKPPLFVSINIFTGNYDLTQKERPNDSKHIPVPWLPQYVQAPGLAWDVTKVAYWEPGEVPQQTASGVTTPVWTDANAPTNLIVDNHLPAIPQDQMVYFLKPADSANPTVAERTIVYDVSGKKLNEFKSIRFDSNLFEVYRGTTQIQITNTNFDLYHPSFDLTANQLLWTIDEVRQGTVQFRFKLDLYNQIFVTNNFQGRVNSHIAVNRQTRKVDFSQNVLANDIIFIIEWDQNLFKVLNKADPPMEQTPAANTNWDPWQPFDSKWSTDTQVQQLLVDFEFIARIPLFERVDWAQQNSNESSEQGSQSGSNTGTGISNPTGITIQGKYLCIQRSDYMVNWEFTYHGEGCQESLFFQVPFSHIYFSILKSDGNPLILESDTTNFETPWDLNSPPKVTGAWVSANLDINDLTTFPKLKLLDGPLIEKIVYRITNLFFMADPSQYELTWRVNKLYNVKTLNLWPCDRSALDTGTLIFQSLISTFGQSTTDPLNFPGIEGWECQNVRKYADANKDKPNFTLKKSTLIDDVEQFMRDNSIYSDDISLKAKADGANVRVVNYPSNSRRILTSTCNTIPIYQFIRLIKVIKDFPDSKFPDVLKGCVDISTRTDVQKILSLTALTIADINQLLSRGVQQQYTQEQLSKIAKTLVEIKAIDLNIASNYKKLAQLFTSLIPLNPKEFNMFDISFRRIINPDGTLQYGLDISRSCVQEFIRILDNAQSFTYNSDYYHSNLFIYSYVDILNQMKFDFEEITITPQQQTAILSGIDTHQSDIIIPWANVQAFAGKVIVFEITFTNKQTGNILTKGSYAAQILPSAQTFELITNIKDIFYINPSSGTDKIAYFEMGKTYNLVWNLAGFTGIQNAKIVYGKYSDKSQLTLTDITSDVTSSQSVQIPALQFGIANYIFILHVEVIVAQNKVIKFGLITVPYVGQNCNTILDPPPDLNQIQNFDEPPTDKAAADNYFDTLNQVNSNQQEPPPVAPPIPSDSKQRKGAEGVCDPSVTTSCNSHGSCFEDSGKLKCQCSTGYKGKTCDESEEDFSKKVAFNQQVLNFVTIPSEKDGQIKAAQNVKDIVKSGAVDDTFLAAANQKIVDALSSVTTVEAVASIIDTLSSLAKAKVDIAAKGKTKEAQQEGLSTIQKGLEQALKISASTTVDFSLSVDGIKLKLVVSFTVKEGRRVLVSSNVYTSSKPDEVEASLAIIPSTHPLLAANKVAFQIYEYSQFSGVEGAGYLLTPLTRVYFVSKTTGLTTQFDSSQPKIQLELFSTESTQTGKTYEGVRLNGLGTVSASFVTDGITVIETKTNSIVIEISSEGAYGIRVQGETPVTIPISSEDKNKNNTNIGFILSTLIGFLLHLN